MNELLKEKVVPLHGQSKTGRAGLDVLLTRQSCLPLNEPAPVDEELALIFDAALCAPDHGELRPWEFAFVRGEGRVALGDILVAAARARDPDAPETTLQSHRGKAMMAPLIIALGANTQVHRKIPEIEQMMAVGAAAMNILNAVHALGYGAFWGTGVDTYDANVLKALGFKQSVRLAGFVFIGTPGKLQTPKVRPDRTDHVREWHGT
ncbi:nitroreductase family protein [Undibacterium sp. Tian12W]|uniref:nitroreductase family protein n=1 Tax=Undibacterium sp. Tian12W TaxID=3413054 RepID=UPI003BF0DDB3